MSVGEWFKKLFSPKVPSTSVDEQSASALPRKVLVSLVDGQVMTGELVSLTLIGVTVGQTAVSNGGAFTPLPAPSTVFMPMHTVSIVQYLPSTVSIETMQPAEEAAAQQGETK